jgi:transcriptional regulator with XRE-family HTH domain
VSQTDKKAIAKAQYIVGSVPRDIAAAIGVSKRTVERWAAENDREWDKLQSAHEASQSGNAQPVTRSPKVVECRRREDEPEDEAEFAVVDADDPLAIADNIIAILQQEFSRPMLGRDRATIANSLRAWVDLRRKLSPPTVGELADLVIELNVSIPEFVAELKARYGIAGERA